MYLYGASGHAKVIIDILKSQNIVINGLFDENENIKELLSYPVYPASKISGPLIISIGKNAIRKKIAENLDVEFGKAIYRTSLISEYATIGVGSVVMQGAIIQADAKMGNHCILNTNASIDHDCEISDYVHLSPNTTLCGNVNIGEGTWIGAGSVILPGVSIGKWSVIGAGSVVSSDIPDNVLALGNRCKIIKKINHE